MRKCHVVWLLRGILNAVPFELPKRRCDKTSRLGISTVVVNMKRSRRALISGMIPIAERGCERNEDHLVRKHQHRFWPILSHDNEKHCELLIRLSDRCKYCD
jgi:hypothetical protein